MPSRYYSQSYEPVDDDLSNARANVGMNDYAQYDRPVTPEMHTQYGRSQHQDIEPEFEHPQSRYEPPRNLDADTSYDRNATYNQAMNQDIHRPTSPAYEDFETLKRPSKPSFFSRQMATGTAWWNRQTKKMKYIILGGIAAVIVILIIIIAVAASLSGSDFHYTPSYAKVTNQTAFDTGGATNDNPYQHLQDGIGAGTDAYTYYQGPAANFPTSDKWVSFEDMWNANKPVIAQSCGWLKEGPDNTPQMIDDIYDAIQNRSAASLVDHRFVLAVVMQESKGCVRVSHTTSSGGTRNPGLMQSHDGHAYDSSSSTMSILQMIQDGTQGTKKGDGLVQNLDMYGDLYSAARGYNSGYIPKSGDLSDAAGATACYVSDIGNRLTGWVNADSKCPDEGDY